MNLTQMASETMRRKEQCNIDALKIGDKVKAIKGRGAFAECIPPMTVEVAKINKKTFKTTCGLSIDLINIREILG